MPDYELLESLTKQHFQSSSELSALRVLAASGSDPSASYSVCSQTAISHMSYSLWEEGSIVHLGGSERDSGMMDAGSLRTHVDFNMRFPTPGVRFDPARQVNTIRTIQKSVRSDEISTLLENWKIRPDAPIRYHVHNTQFGPIDASVLYCMVRHFKPKRVVEVGAGSSTNVLVQAFRENRKEGRPVNFTSVEPFPSEHAVLIAKEFGQLIPEKAEDVPTDVWAALQPGDILFIDSSHLLRIDSEIIPLFARILPALPPGVIVHVHDIYLPTPYPSKFYSLRWLWNEEFALQALLVESTAFKVCGVDDVWKHFHNCSCVLLCHFHGASKCNRVRPLQSLLGNHYVYTFLDRKEDYNSGPLREAAALQKRLDEIARNGQGKRRARFPVPSSFYFEKIA